MPKFKDISRTTNTVRIFVGDKMHIKNMIKEFKMEDPRFKDEATAIRYYCHVGISAQAATENLKNSLDNTIVKKSIKDAVRDELKSHTNNVELLGNKLEEFTQKLEANFGDIARRTEKLENRVQLGFETIINLLTSVLSTGENILRNIIVLRTVFYIFFLGHKTGRIEPGKENKIKWERIIVTAHKSANDLSVTEVNLLSKENLEGSVIHKMANEIFESIENMPPAANK